MATNNPDPIQPDPVKLSEEAAAKAAEAAAANKAREEATKLDPATAPYVVAAGGSVSCLRGVVEEGQPVQAIDFAGGKAALIDLVNRGAVISRKSTKPVVTE